MNRRYIFFRLRHWLLLLGCGLLLAAGAASCRLLWSGATRAAEPVSQLVLTTLGDPKTFNPVLNQEFPNVFLFTARGLVREYGTTGEIVPELAESWQVSEDGQRIVFTLRPDLRWSDGEPLTAADVVFTYRDVVFNDKIPTSMKDSLQIGSDHAFPQVQALDQRRVEFTLPEPFAPFLRAVAAVWLVPQHSLQEAVTTVDSEGNPLFISTWGTDTNPVNLVVNGPYQIEGYRPSERVVFRRNPYYWRQDEQGQQLPYIDRIVWQVMESTDTQLLRFRSGDLDVMGDVRPLRPEYFSLLKREEDRGRFTVQVGGPWSGTTFISFNLNQGINAQGQPVVDPVKSRWFNSVEFRRAIAHSINRQRIINNIYRGISEPQNSPVSVQSPYYLSPSEGLPVYDYDLDQARTLLQSAGFHYNPAEQLLDADGNRVQFTLLTNSGNEIREAIGAQIKQDLSLIGIQVNFTPINFNTLITRLTTTRDWDCFLLGFTGGLEPHSGANLWTSSGSSHLFNLGPQPGQPPLTNWQPSTWEREIDRLFAAGAQELDETRRQAIYASFQQIVQEQLPVTYLVHELALMAVRNRVQGIDYSGLPSWGLWNIETLNVVDDEG